MGEPGSSGDIQVVQRVAQLLTQFTIDRPQLSIAEAAALVGLNRTTVARYFGSMMTAGLLERAADETSAYVPGRLLLQLGALAQGQRRVLELAPAHMLRLAQETGLTTVLSLLGATGPVVSLVSEARNFPILITVRVGTVLDMNSAQGHLFLRFSEDTDMTSRYWASLNDADRERVQLAVAATSNRGLAPARTPSFDVSVLSSPVFDEHSIAATLAFVGTTARLPADSPRHELALLRAALRLSEELGGAETWREHIDEIPEVAALR